MRISVEWQDDAPNASAEERATIADVQVFVDEVNVCEHLVGQASGAPQPSGEATVSAYPIAEALAFEWWRLFGRRDDEFRLFNHRCAYALPDLRISHDGERFTVASKAREYANPPVARSVVNDLHDASRQALGRAFAAEFLAPVEEILSMREDGKDTASIAAEFGVSEEVVERQLRNRRRIETACAA